MNKYIVLRKAETQPLEAWEFQEKADAVAHFDRASWQWSDTFLCEVLAGPGKPLTSPSPDVDFETALAGCWLDTFARQKLMSAYKSALSRAREEERTKCADEVDKWSGFYKVEGMDKIAQRLHEVANSLRTHGWTFIPPETPTDER